MNKNINILIYSVLMLKLILYVIINFFKFNFQEENSTRHDQVIIFNLIRQLCKLEARDTTI